VIVVNDSGEILLIRRTDNGNWAVEVPRGFRTVALIGLGSSERKSIASS
jgi:hypothetical protein